MAAVDRASSLLTLCVLLLPAVIGTQSEGRECAFADPLQSRSGAGAAHDLRGVVKENRTIHCSRGFNCFGLWEVKSDGDVVLVKQGCWTSQPECLSERCLVTATPAHIQNGTYRFCCCSHDLCNANFTEAPPTAPPPVLKHADSHPLRRQETAVISFVTVAVVAVLIMLLFFGYRFIRGRQKLSQSTLNVMETANASCVDLDDLKLMELIGRGRYGSVYHGSLDERSVAVKVFSSSNRQNYANERSIYSLPLLRQQHNIAHFLFADERTNSDGCTEYLIVMDHYPHGSLSQFLSHSTVDWTSCCRMMHGVTQGLAFLHSEIQAGDEYKPAVAHRDMSSRNVLVRADLSCVLADFGLSMKLTGNQGCCHGNENNLAISEVGTLRYMAPEVLGGALNLREYQTALKQVDIYALGLLYWENFSRCHDLFPGEAVPDYQLAFEMELGKQPSFEDMQVLVVREKYRPLFPPAWNDHSLVLRLLKETMEDCWDQDAEARLSAQCAEERLSELSLLSLHPLHKHRNASNGCWPSVSTTPYLTENMVKNVQHQSVSSISSGAERGDRKCANSERQQLQACPSALENIIQTTSGSASCSAAQYTGGAVPGVLVRLPLDPAECVQASPGTTAAGVQKPPQRPSSLQLLSTRSQHSPVLFRDRQGRHRTRSRQVETGVAKMNTVAVLAAPEPCKVSTVTNRSAVMMVANGSSAGVPTLVTNSLIVRGQTNPAGPPPEEHLSSRNPDQMGDQELGLNLNPSPDEHQPLLRNELPPAGTHFLSAQRSNSNNNNNRSNSDQRTDLLNHTPAEDKSYHYVPAKTSFFHQPTQPSEKISNQDKDELTNNGELPDSCVQSSHSQLEINCKDQVRESTFQNQESPVFFNQTSDPKQDPSQTPDHSHHSTEENTDNLIGYANNLQSYEASECTKSQNTAHVESEQVFPVAETQSSAPEVVLRNHELFSNLTQSAANLDRPRRPERPCSLDLSSTSAFPDGVPPTDTGLSASGEKIKRRVKTPYTVKKWRPASLVVPSEAAFDFTNPDLFRSPRNAPKINQSKSSMAVFLVGGGARATAASEPDGITSF